MLPRLKEPREHYSDALALSRSSIRVVFYVSVAVGGILLHRPIHTLWHHQAKFIESLSATLEVAGVVWIIN
jgi:hypothetical protein